MSFLATSPWFLNIPRGKRSKRMIRKKNAGHATSKHNGASKHNRRLQSGTFEKRRISHRNTDHAASKQIKRLSTRISHRNTDHAASKQIKGLSTRISHKNTDHEASEQNKRLDSGAFESYLE